MDLGTNQAQQPSISSQQPEKAQFGQPLVPQNISTKSPLSKILLSVLGALVVLGLIGGAYYLGTKNNSVSYKTQSVLVPSVTPAPSVVIATSVASAPPNLQTLVAGGVYTFSKYQVSFPVDWQESRTNTNAGDIVTLTKNNYQIKINQGGFDGGACSYSDKPITTGIFQTFASFAEFKDQDGALYRRGKIDQSGYPNQDQYEVCAFSTKNNVFQEFTPFGRIDYLTPLNADNSMLSGMDSIITSLKVQ